MTTKIELQIKIVLAQAEQFRARAMYRATRIQSGAYKMRVVHHGSFDGPQFTEQELLEEELRIMGTHITHADDYLDHAMGLLAEIK